MVHHNALLLNGPPDALAVVWRKATNSMATEAERRCDESGDMVQIYQNGRWVESAASNGSVLEAVQGEEQDAGKEGSRVDVKTNRKTRKVGNGEEIGCPQKSDKRGNGEIGRAHV